MNELPVIACSLTGEELPERRARWGELIERALTDRTEIAAGVRLCFRAEQGVEDELQALAELERGCCGFADFAVSASDELVTLDVTSSGDGVPAVRQLFL
jgi:hypothetical protein